jgi:hypothetical protein
VYRRGYIFRHTTGDINAQEAQGLANVVVSLKTGPAVTAAQEGFNHHPFPYPVPVNLIMDANHFPAEFVTQD